MHVEVKDPNQELVLSRVYSAEGMVTILIIFWADRYLKYLLSSLLSGRVSFTSHVPGEHTICLFSNSSHWFSGSQLRIHLDIQVGEHAVDYAKVAQTEKLTELQLRIRQLLNQVDQITKEQNYQRVRFPLFFE